MPTVGDGGGNDIGGGPVVGATTDPPSVVFSVTGSGGMVVGEVVQPPYYTVMGSGGALVGAHVSAPYLSYSQTGSGGPRIGSTTVPAMVFPITATGGPIAGGSFSPSSDNYITATGGPIVGASTAEPTWSASAIVSGGVLLTQHLQPPQPPTVFSVSGLGGVIVGTSGDEGHIAGGFYHVYMNSGTGDAVNYDFPVETTSITTWTTGSLPYPGDYSFHVRAFYGSPYLEEHNLDARIRVVLDATGADVTGRPAAPTQLAAATLKGGTVRLSWLYKTPGGRAMPSKFNVYAGTPGVSYAAFVQQIAYGSDGRYFAVVSGLTNGMTYQFVVRAANATAEEPNTTIVTATSDSSGPDPPEGLVAGSI